jgi:hypothetical protein
MPPRLTRLSTPPVLRRDGDAAIEDLVLAYGAVHSGAIEVEMTFCRGLVLDKMV